MTIFSSCPTSSGDKISFAGVHVVAVVEHFQDAEKKVGLLLCDFFFTSQIDQEFEDGRPQLEARESVFGQEALAQVEQEKVAAAAPLLIQDLFIGCYWLVALASQAVTLTQALRIARLDLEDVFTERCLYQCRK